MLEYECMFSSLIGLVERSEPCDFHDLYYLGTAQGTRPDGRVFEYDVLKCGRCGVIPE
jgi:hypothetical protein